MEYEPVAQQTAWQQSDDIDQAHTALVVIDVLGGNTGIPADFAEPIRNCITLAKAARAKGVPVIFTNDNHRPPHDRELELWGEHGLVGTEGGKPLTEFELADTDIIIPKRRYNAFFGTDLDITLRELGVDTIIVVGADANICVLQTLAGAYFLGYKSIVPADAVWTFLIGTHQGALEYYATCYDTRIVDTAHVLGEYLA